MVRNGFRPSTVCIISQPEEVIILYRGEVAYHGAASELAAYFESIGYECPAKYNPADHVIDLTQSLGEERMKKVKARVCAIP